MGPGMDTTPQSFDSPPPLPPSEVPAGFDYDPTWESVAWGLTLLCLNGTLSLVLDLGLHGALVLATLRMVLQLSALGMILTPIFQNNSWPVVVSYGIFMNYFAVLEATSRGHLTYKGQLLNTLCCMSVASAFTLAYAILVVVRVHPWYEASYAIPTLGMILGNCTSSVSLGLTTILDELKTGKDRIEWQLALGATRWEALKASLNKAMTTATMPLLNSMSVLGLVAIPGMMTGQILSGEDPISAARSQMIIMCLIGGASCFSSTLSIYLAAATIVDEHHTFRSDLLLTRSPTPSGPSLRERITSLITALVNGCCCCFISSSPRGSHDEEEGVNEPLILQPGVQYPDSILPFFSEGMVGNGGHTGPQDSRQFGNAQN